MAVKTLPELKVSDLVREYKSSFVDTWDGLDKAAKDFKKQLIEAALEAERTELLLCRSYERTSGRQTIEMATGPDMSSSRMVVLRSKCHGFGAGL